MKKISDQQIHIKKIESWIKKLLRLPSGVFIKIDEKSIKKDESNLTTFTDIIISLNKKENKTFSLPVSIDKITEQDIADMQKSFEEGISGAGILTRAFVRLFGWWVIFAGSLTVFSICPVCGQTGCPAGIGITGIVAGILAIVKLYAHSFFQKLKHIFRK